jgi:Transglycosylase SLT domain
MTMESRRAFAASALATAIRASATAKLLAAAAAATAAVLILALLLLGWLAVVAGQSSAASCTEPVGDLQSDEVPAQLVPLFTGAARRYELGSRGPAILAAVTKIESDFGRNLGPSSAGAIGWTQFMPATWRAYGVDADRDGRRDPNTAADAIYAAANYLHASGAPRDWHRALFAYNHAQWYVDHVLEQAARYATTAGTITAAADPFGGVCADALTSAADVGGTRRVFGGGRIVAMPGFPGRRIDERLVPDVVFLVRRFNIGITEGYAPTGHKSTGEHPLGLALDIVPGAGGSWEDIDRLARWAEPRQGQPRAPWRWVGYDGDADHGRGHHLHLSWDHSPTPPGRPPARWVRVLDLAGTG